MAKNVFALFSPSIVDSDDADSSSIWLGIDFKNPKWVFMDPLLGTHDLWGGNGYFFYF